jgi:BolA family transcriptional regulator, general stress-responsive regulator
MTTSPSQNPIGLQSTAQTQALIKMHLMAMYEPESLTVTDDSEEHAGHAGSLSGKGHFTVTIQKKAWQDMPLLQIHRLVYEALGDLMNTQIHALSIQYIR